MDIVELIRSSGQDYGVIFTNAWYNYMSLELKTAIYLHGSVALLTLVIVVWFLFYRRLIRHRALENLLREQSSAQSAGGDMHGLRFRKRDKMLFYGRRMLRKVKNVSGQVYGGQGRKRKAVMRFAKRILQLRRDNIPLEMKTVEPPAEYLEETMEGSDRVPPDALYMLQSIRIFGHFEKPIFLKLCKHTEVLEVEPGEYLFKITDADDSVFIVQSGVVNVFISNADGTTLSLKTVRKGESVTSLLSFVDVLSGNPSFYKTVTAKAVERSVVIRLPMQAFKEVFDENPDIMIRVIQVIMIRLQRVLFTALRNYLGLNSELVQNHMRLKKTLGTQPQAPQSQPPQTIVVPLQREAQREAQRESQRDSHRESQREAQREAQRDSHRDAHRDSHRESQRESHRESQREAQRESQRESIKYSPVHRRPENFQHTLSDMGPPPDMLVGLAHESQLNVAVQQATAVTSGASACSLSTRRYSLTFSELNAHAACIDVKLVQASAVESMQKELGLDDNDRAMLEKIVVVREVEAGVTLIQEGNSDDICIWFVMTGSLAVYQRGVESPRGLKSDKAEVLIHHVHPGEIVGGLAVLTGEASAYTIKSRQHTRVALIPRPDIYQIMREHPNIVLHLGNGVVRRLSPLVRQCDYALDWIFLESGRAVYRQDESSDSTYIVLSGRMRSVITHHSSGKKEIVGEYGKGDLVGIVEMITETSRTTTVMAVRDSELAKLPEGLFNAIKLRYPIVVTKLISLLSHRILGTMTRHNPGGSTAPLEANPVTHKYSTVALVPVSDDVPLTAFTYELYHSLCAIGPTLRLTSDVVRKQLGMHIFEASNEYRLTSWLAQQEDRSIITLYQCDSSLSAWTQRCMRQADVILIVGLGDRTPTVGKFEREIDRLAMRTQKELVLLYSESGSAKPINTLQWLNVRPWVTKHHHLQCAKRMFTRKSQYRINDLYSRVLMSEPNMHSDFSRLARWLTGNSIGLVLGGGGARGAAHIGMMKAIQEAGIPIDMVGGVSIGAFMGALWCSERNITTVTQKAREWSKKMTKWFLQLLDLTYPITSMFSGREFNKTIRDTFGEVTIEDMWIPYFTLTTDITASCHRIHTNGSLWRFVRSSMSLSGYMPPLCDPKDGHLLLDGGYVNNLPGHLWRYVRASMTVAGILPPFCDYKDGHLLLDGCYTNNVPADVMHNLGAAHIIAIDVGSQDDTDLTNYGDDLSGWWLLYKKWNPFTTPIKVPNLPDIQSRLAYVSCVRQLEEVKNSDYCEYIRPPIDKYKTLAFGSFDEIRDVGYVFGKNYFDAMAKAGRLGRFNQWFNKEPPKKDNHPSLSEYTFIDLAQIVCKLPETYIDHQLQHHYNYFYSEDEEFDGYISEPSTYRVQHVKIKRTGTSLSLSENELDSDIEVDLTLDLRQHAQRSRSTPQSPASETRSVSINLSLIDSVDASNANSPEDTPAMEAEVSDDEATPRKSDFDGVEELPLDPVYNNLSSSQISTPAMPRIKSTTS